MRYIALDKAYSLSLFSFSGDELVGASVDAFGSLSVSFVTEWNFSYTLASELSTISAFSPICFSPSSLPREPSTMAFSQWRYATRFGDFGLYLGDVLAQLLHSHLGLFRSNGRRRGRYIVRVVHFPLNLFGNLVDRLRLLFNFWRSTAARPL